MLQVVNRADAGGQASAAGSPSPQTPHPRATDARSRGIKFPISRPARPTHDADGGITYEVDPDFLEHVRREASEPLE